MKGGEEQSTNVSGISFSWREEANREFGAPLGILERHFPSSLSDWECCLSSSPSPLILLFSSSSPLILLFSSHPPHGSISHLISFPAPTVGSHLSVSLPPSLTPYLPRALLEASALLRRGRMSHRESPPAPSLPPQLLGGQRRDVEGEDGPERAKPLSDTERELIQDTWGHIYKNCEDVGVSVLIR